MAAKLVGGINCHILQCSKEANEDFVHCNDLLGLIGNYSSMNFIESHPSNCSIK